MRRIVISVLAWTGYLLLVFGAYRLFLLNFSGISMNGIWSGIPFLAIGFLVIYVANRLGWDGLADLVFVVQFFQREQAAIRNRIAPRTQDALKSPEKRRLPRIRPPIKLHRYLLTSSLIFVLGAIVLELIRMARGEPGWGHSVLDIVEYVFLGIAALFYLTTLLLDFIFFIRSIKRGR
jgi:hypothetical protein